MIWLTWRQFRAPIWAALGALAVLATALAVTGPGLRDFYADSGLATCRDDCAEGARTFLAQATAGIHLPLYLGGLIVMVVLPALVGLFWGAPLVARELEAGTFRLIWSQSVTRTRWLSVKLLGGAAVSVAFAGLASLAVSWWAVPFDKAYDNRIQPQVFPMRGIVPIGYAALAFVLGVAVGMILRRTVAAMALTLVAVAAIQIVMPFWVRPHLATPVRIEQALDTSELRSLMMSDGGRIEVTGHVDSPGAWVVSNETMTSDGRPFTGPYDENVCGRIGDPSECKTWLGSLGLRQRAAYHPAERVWTLQWRETALLRALAVVVAGGCFWWLRRRLT